jgi:hypothetical protein
VILIRKLGRHWRMITFTSLLHDLIPHSINCTTPPSHPLTNTISLNPRRDNKDLPILCGNNLFPWRRECFRCQTTYTGERTSKTTRRIITQTNYRSTRESGGTPNRTQHFFERSDGGRNCCWTFCLSVIGLYSAGGWRLCILKFFIQYPVIALGQCTPNSPLHRIEN